VFSCLLEKPLQLPLKHISPNLQSLDSRHSPHHADPERPVITRGALAAAPAVKQRPRGMSSVTLISGSVQVAKYVARPCDQSTDCASCFQVRIWRLTPAGRLTAYLAASRACWCLFKVARDKSAHVRAFFAGIDTADSALLQLYLGHSRVVREVSLLPRHASNNSVRMRGHTKI